MGIDMAVGENCQHALHRGKVFMVLQTCLFQVLLFLFQYQCLPTSIVWSQVSPSQTPVIKDIPIPCVSHSYFHLTDMSCQPMAANAVRHSQLLIQHCPIWEWENDPFLYIFITLFCLSASFPKSSLGNVLMSSSTLKTFLSKFIKSLIVCICK